ncbi:MAG: hypothetical protein LUD25_05415 [Coriobacteriaceae bacterium]|nr:hypothetical protein [Coriobacteriaceae bacterium]
MLYGCKGAVWAPTSSDDDASALPKYGKTVSLEGINDANETLNFADASAYGDNQEKIKLREFTDGSIDVKLVHQEAADAAAMIGCAIDEDGALFYGGDDVAPTGGFGFYHTLLDTSKKKYSEVVFFPKTQSTIEGKDYQTKEDNLNMEYVPITMDIMSPLCDKYKIEKRFDTEAEAEEYLQSLFAGQVEVPTT